MSCAVWAERVEVSAAGPVAGGLSSGTENARWVADPAADLCSRCERRHLPRERAVPCRSCGQDTFDVRAVCSSCEAAPS